MFGGGAPGSARIEGTPGYWEEPNFTEQADGSHAVRLWARCSRSDWRESTEEFTLMELTFSADGRRTGTERLATWSRVTALPPPGPPPATIGTYIDASHSNPALGIDGGTSWLLKDAAAARAADVKMIYRGLGGQTKLAAAPQTVGFEEHTDRCFVSPAARATLMARLDAAFEESVGASDYSACDTKMTLTHADLEALVGAPSVAAMREAFGAPIDKIKMRRVCLPPSQSMSDSTAARVIDFHFDTFSKTMGIALNDASEYGGSRLTFALPGVGLVAAKRRAGTATVHTNQVAHGVTPLTHGVRYGLFLLSH